jgi:F0F1-type ATP synthase assembly protein I
MADSGDPSLYVHLYQWSARASTIAFEMVIPALIGIWLDRLLGTVVLLTILGVFFGMALGFWQLLKIAHDAHNIEVDKSSDAGNNEESSVS